MRGMKRKKLLISSILMIMIVCLIFLFVWNPFIYKLNISFYKSISAQDVVLKKDWIMLTSEDQIQNLKINTIPLNEMNFDEHFLVLSKYKIKSLYYGKIRDDCNCGPPFGQIKTNKKDNNKDLIYVYKTEKKWLYQAIG